MISAEVSGLVGEELTKLARRSARGEPVDPWDLLVDSDFLHATAYRRLQKLASRGRPKDEALLGNYEEANRLRSDPKGLATLISRIEYNLWHSYHWSRPRFIRAGKRWIGVRPVSDQIVEAGMAKLLVAIMEPGFSDRSFGYSARRNALAAKFDLTEALSSRLFDFVVCCDMEKCLGAAPLK